MREDYSSIFMLNSNSLKKKNKKNNLISYTVDKYGMLKIRGKIMLKSKKITQIQLQVS